MDRCRIEVPPLAPALSGAEHLSACWLPRDKAARDGLRRKVLSQVVAAEA